MHSKLRYSSALAAFQPDQIAWNIFLLHTLITKHHYRSRSMLLLSLFSHALELFSHRFSTQQVFSLFKDDDKNQPNDLSRVFFPGGTLSTTLLLEWKIDGKIEVVKLRQTARKISVEWDDEKPLNFLALLVVPHRIDFLVGVICNWKIFA